MQAILVLEAPTDDEVRATLRWNLPSQAAPPSWTPGLVRRADQAARSLLGLMELHEAGPTRLYRRPSTSGRVRAHPMLSQRTSNQPLLAAA